MSSIDRPRKPLAYQNEQFLDSVDARPLRILAEYLEPLHTFHHEHIRDTIVFFGSARLSSKGPLGHYYDAARELARELDCACREAPADRPIPVGERALVGTARQFTWFARHRGRRGLSARCVSAP